MTTRCFGAVCQVSLAFVLLIGSGLLTLSFARLLAVDPGFQAQNVQTAQFSLPRARYQEDAQVCNFVGGLLGRVLAIPGVREAIALCRLSSVRGLAGHDRPRKTMVCTT